WEMGSINADSICEDENENPLPNGLGKAYYVPLNFRDVSQPLPAANPAPSEPVPPAKKPQLALVGRGYQRLFSNLVGEVKEWKTFSARRAAEKFKGSLLEP